MRSSSPASSSVYLDSEVLYNPFQARLPTLMCNIKTTALIKYFITLIAFLITINTQGQSNIEIGIVRPDYLYEMNGKIGDLDIDMFYRISQNTITGYYYYEKYDQPINILGLIKNDTILIYEFDNEINKTGLFKGFVTNNSVFNGNWINLKSNKKTPFELKGTITPFKNLKCEVYIKKDNVLKFYNLADSIVGMPFDFYLLDYSKKNGDHFFLFKMRSLSKPYGNGNGLCGAGYEEKLVLLQLDYEFGILKESSYVINSCWYNYTTEEADINWEEGKYLKIKGDIFESKGDTIFLISYDKSNPESGLKIEYRKGK
jgi:hypothetical protein